MNKDDIEKLKYILTKNEFPDRTELKSNNIKISKSKFSEINRRWLELDKMDELKSTYGKLKYPHFSWVGFIKIGKDSVEETLIKMGFKIVDNGDNIILKSFKMWLGQEHLFFTVIYDLLETTDGEKPTMKFKITNGEKYELLTETEELQNLRFEIINKIKGE